METQQWLRHLPAACSPLLLPGLLCQAALNEKLEEVAAEFVWLDEIYNEALRLFSIKSTKLEQMPKTPSLKLRGKKAGKMKILKVKSELEDDDSLANPKGVPTKLKFESPKNLAMKNDSVVTGCVRPVRNCRMTTKASYADENDYPKRSTRQSKKPIYRSISDEFSLGEDKRHSLQKLSNATVKLEVETSADNVIKVKTCTSLVAKQKSEDKSPSVRDRTKAYESMLKIRMSESPVLKHSGLVGPNKVASPVQISGSPKGVMSVHASNPECNKSVKGTSVQQISQICAEKDEPKQTRTRLRLKKQKQEDDMDIEESRPLDGRLGADNDQHAVQLTTDMQTDEQGSCGHQSADCYREVLNETQTVITEVFDIGDKGQPAKLREFEIVQTKTTPICERVRPLLAADCVSDQGFNDGDMESTHESSDFQQVSTAGHEMKQVASSTPRAHGENDHLQDRSRCKPNKDSGVVSEVASRADSTFVKETKSAEVEIKVTRTRTRAAKETVSHETPTERMTRTRQRKQDAAPQTSQDVKSTRDAPVEVHAAVQESCAMTRSRMRKALDPNKLAICGSDDEIIASSPVVATSRLSLRGGKKRLADERGLSPRPKRSCVADESSLNIRSPQSTSSPVKKRDAVLANEVYDRVASPRRSPRAFKFSSAQKVTSGFLNRTPGFGQNTSKLCSFLSNTPTCRSTSFLTSFLKRNTPPPKQNNQVLQEQKRQKLLEKENKDKERLKRAADLRKKRIEDQKRMREEKEQKVAEAREMRLRNEQEYKNRINKKLEDKATVKVKLMEERIKEEKEKQKQRLKKQMDADTRRKFEEEERLKKFLEQEEETKQHEEFMQRKKEFEEAERRRQIAEEKRKQEERLAELEQKRQEDLVRLRQAEEEKDKDRERLRLEKEKQNALERAERERIEREKREEKEKKIQEEIEKLKAMERERLRCQQERLQQQKQEETHQNVIRQMINKHNTSLSKQPVAGLNSSTAANTSSGKINSYEITPVKEKIVTNNKNTDNYDIDDKGSDESTDDEEAPKKRIPEWATGIPLNTALIRQHMNPPDIEAIFRTRCIEPPNLLLVFPGKKRAKYIQRTSSAIWNSPPLPRH
ncbi:hypothetical protein BsWGS_27807 [Bradybaena similaris]